MVGWWTGGTVRLNRNSAQQQRAALPIARTQRALALAINGKQGRHSVRGTSGITTLFKRVRTCSRTYSRAYAHVRVTCTRTHTYTRVRVYARTRPRHPQAHAYRKESRGPYTDCLVPLYNQYSVQLCTASCSLCALCVQLSALSVYSPVSLPTPFPLPIRPL